MILFELRLGPAQIAALRCIASGTYSANPPPEEQQERYDGGPGWTLGVRRLSAERLIKWYPTGNFAHKYLDPRGGPHWEITDKGRLVLQLIDMEIADHQATVAAMLATGERIRITAPKKHKGK